MKLHTHIHTHTFTQAFIFVPCKISLKYLSSRIRLSINLSTCCHLVARFGATAAMGLANVNRHKQASAHIHRRQIKPLSLQMKGEGVIIHFFLSLSITPPAFLLTRFLCTALLSPSSPYRSLFSLCLHPPPFFWLLLCPPLCLFPSLSLFSTAPFSHDIPLFPLLLFVFIFSFPSSPPSPKSKFKRALFARQEGNLCCQSSGTFYVFISVPCQCTLETTVESPDSEHRYFMKKRFMFWKKKNERK